MKKAGLITIALVLVATAGIILYYCSHGGSQEIPLDKGQGTMVQRDTGAVKEYNGCKKYYM